MNAAASPAAPTICLLVARWGPWPPWLPLLLRGYAANRDVRFTLLGDTQPEPPLPPNVQYTPWPLPRLLRRLSQRIGFSAGKLSVNNHSTSKISDLKPMFGHVFSDLLQGCAYWGNLQDDVVLGRLRDWFPPALLRAHDVFSPLPAPFDSCGPFMLYRNTEPVNGLYRRSAQLGDVLRDARYMVFDEWWGRLRGLDNMAKVTRREAEAGRLRVYNGPIDPRKRRGSRKALGWEDRLYLRGEAKPSFDEGFVISWTGDGTLWQGPGPAGAAQARASAPAASSSVAPAGHVFDAFVPGAGFQLAFAHMIDAKRRASLGKLRGGSRFARLVGRARGFILTRHGVWLELAHAHHWYSGAFPSLHALVSSSDLAANLSRLSRIRLAASRGTRASVVDRYLPCVRAVRADGDGVAPALGEFARAVGGRPCNGSTDARNGRSAVEGDATAGAGPTSAGGGALARLYF